MAYRLKTFRVQFVAEPAGISCGFAVYSVKDARLKSQSVFKDDLGGDPGRGLEAGIVEKGCGAS